MKRSTYLYGISCSLRPLAVGKAKIIDEWLTHKTTEKPIVRWLFFRATVACVYHSVLSDSMSNPSACVLVNREVAGRVLHNDIRDADREKCNEVLQRVRVDRNNVLEETNDDSPDKPTDKQWGGDAFERHFTAVSP